jgi:DHA1 family inner membrane transport protein
MKRVGSNWLVPLSALFVATFAVGCAEMIVGGILPAIAADFSIDIPTVGTLIAGYALGVALGGPVLTLATSRVARRPLLLWVTALFVTGNVVCALATSYWMLLGARLIVSTSHGLFVGVATVVATRLAPADRQSTAISLIVAGFSAAALVGLPIGTAIGNLYSWRAVFWIIAAMGVGATLVLAVLIPKGEGEAAAEADLRAELRAIMRPGVLVGYALIMVFICADLTVYTYIVPMLTDVTHIGIAYVPWLLFVAGIAGIVGNLVGGRLGDWNPMATAIGIFALLVFVQTGVALAMPYPVAMVIACVFWWLVGFAFPAPIQARILKDASDAPNLASTLISTAFNIGIAAGAFLGAFVLDAGWGYQRLPWIAVGFEIAGLIIGLALVAMDRRGRLDHAAVVEAGHGPG